MSGTVSSAFTLLHFKTHYILKTTLSGGYLLVKRTPGLRNTKFLELASGKASETAQKQREMLPAGTAVPAGTLATSYPGGGMAVHSWDSCSIAFALLENGFSFACAPMHQLFL